MFGFPVSKKLLFHYLRSNCHQENATLAIKSGKVQKKNKKIHPADCPGRFPEELFFCIWGCGLVECGGK